MCNVLQDCGLDCGLEVDALVLEEKLLPGGYQKISGEIDPIDLLEFYFGEIVRPRIKLLRS